MASLWLLAAAAAGRTVTFDLSDGRAQPCPVRPAGEVVVCARTARDNVFPITVDGAPARLLVEPGGPRQLVCDPRFAMQAAIEGRRPVSIGRIGPEKVMGSIGEARIVIDGAATTVRISWPTHSFLTQADCWAGPGALPQPIVRFLLGPAVPGARTVALPEHDGRGMRDSATDARLTIGRMAVMVRFDALNTRTALTAPAALLIARAGGARLDGPMLETGIYYGMRRPIRRLLTPAPLVVGPLSIPTLFARVSDYADASGIHSTDASEFQPDDIIVTSRQPKIEGSRIIRVGRDDLARCESITFDREAKRITLTC